MIQRQNERRCIDELQHDTNHNSNCQSSDLNKSPSSIQSNVIVPRESIMIYNTKLNPPIAINLLEHNLSSVSVQKHAFKLLLNFELSQIDKLEIEDGGHFRRSTSVTSQRLALFAPGGPGPRLPKAQSFY